MKKVLGILAVAAVLVAAAAFTAAALGTFSPAIAQEGTTTTTEAQDPDTRAETEDDASLDTISGLANGFVGSFVDDVLADLAEANKITQKQADEISAAFETKIDELIGSVDLKDMRGLPFLGKDNPLHGYLEDGELSDEERAELEELFGESLGGGGRFGGFPFGRGGEGNPDQFKRFFEDFDFGSIPFLEEDNPLPGYLEDGELSEQERQQLREYFEESGGPGLGRWFHHFDDDTDAEEGALSG